MTKLKLSSNLQEYSLDEPGGDSAEKIVKQRTDAKGNEHIVILTSLSVIFRAWPIREILKDNGAGQRGIWNYRVFFRAGFFSSLRRSPSKTSWKNPPGRV